VDDPRFLHESLLHGLALTASPLFRNNLTFT